MGNSFRSVLGLLDGCLDLNDCGPCFMITAVVRLRVLNAGYAHHLKTVFLTCIIPPSAPHPSRHFTAIESSKISLSLNAVHNGSGSLYHTLLSTVFPLHIRDVLRRIRCGTVARFRPVFRHRRPPPGFVFVSLRDRGKASTCFCFHI